MTIQEIQYAYNEVVRALGKAFAARQHMDDRISELKAQEKRLRVAFDLAFEQQNAAETVPDTIGKDD